MSGVRTETKFTVYMDRRDITPWVKSLTVSQPRKTLWRTFDITLFGWAAVNAGSTFDIYIGTSSSSTRQECVISNGLLPPEKPPQVRFSSDGNVIATVSGYDYVWKTANRRPRSTLVLTDRPGGMSVERALEAYRANGPLSGYTQKTPRGYPVGRTGIIYGVNTMHDAVEKLARMAGCDAAVLLPNYSTQPIVVPPTQSYWDVIRNLVAPYKPVTAYNRFSNMLIFSESINLMTGSFRGIEITEKAIRSVGAYTITPAMPRRIILRVNRWV